MEGVISLVGMMAKRTKAKDSTFTELIEVK